MGGDGAVYVWRGVLAIAFGACTFACTHKADDPGAPADDLTGPSQSTSEAPPAPPDPLGPPVLPPSGGGGGTDPPKPVIPVFYGVDEDGNLVHFERDTPGKVTSVAITGLQPKERVLGIDFRPKDGALYALGSSSRLYTINRDTAKASAIGTAPFTPALAGQSFGFDFDPVADGARVHSDFDQDMMLDPDLGTVAGVDPQLTFEMTDTNGGQNPNLVATAYTNSTSPAPAATDLYALDSTRNLLVHLADPYAGRAATVGALGVDADDVAGFDITGTGEAYAALRVAGTTGLYVIDLKTGEAKSMGNIGVTTGLHGLAIQP